MYLMKKLELNSQFFRNYTINNPKGYQEGVLTM